MKSSNLFIVLSFVSQVGLAQSLKPIFEKTPKSILPSSVLASYPKNTFLENLTLKSNGDLFVTNYPAGLIIKITVNGTKSDYVKIPGKIAGIAPYHTDEFLVTGWDTSGKPSVFLVDGSKNVSVLTSIEGGMFPNGITKLAGEKYLIADSYAGCVWLFDARSKKTDVWLKNDLLARSSAKAQLPAANGIKIFKNAVYISNTEKQTLIKVPLVQGKPGEPELYLDNVNIDDFAFDQTGNIYGATHFYNDVIKISPDKTITIIAGLEQGAAGCTAIAVSKNNSGQSFLYVTTNGGMSIPPPTGIEEGKVIKINLSK